MGRRAIYTGSKFGGLAGYSPALVDGDRIVLSATASFDAAGLFDVVSLIFRASAGDQLGREASAIASEGVEQ